MTTKTTKNAIPAGSSLLDPSRESAIPRRKPHLPYEIELLIEEHAIDSYEDTLTALIAESDELKLLYQNVCPDCRHPMEGAIPGRLVCHNCLRSDTFE